MSASSSIPADRIERRILLVRGQKVLLDFQLAELYEVETKALNQAVKRNLERFPVDFMFQLSEEEMDLVLRSQSVTSSDANASKPTKTAPSMWSQSVTTSAKFRRATHLPYAFTEQGVAMLASVLRSARAVQVNIAIMRAFVQLRQLLSTHADLARKLASLERKYDEQFRAVFDAIRELMEPPTPAQKREIGFHPNLPERESKPRSRSRAKVSP